MPDAVPPFVRQTKDGVIIELHVQPRASRNKVVGLHGSRLKVAVQAPPADGKANKAVQKLLARLLDVPKSSVILKSGASSREKSFILRDISLQRVCSKIGF